MDISSELATIQLGDQRLNKRARQLLVSLNDECQTSINGACAGWAESKAAYRFFDNPQADPEQILAAHRDATLLRMQEQPTVCIAQDTTELDYSSHPTRDARYLNSEYRQGLYDHSSVAFTPDKMCLGVLDAQFFDRPAETLGTTRERRHDPIESKESFRWVEGYRLCCQMAAECPDTEIVSVADREGDIFEVFAVASEHPTPAELVIRHNMPRRTTERASERSRRSYYDTHETVATSDVRCRRTIQLPATPKRTAREAQLEIRAVRLTLKPPQGFRKVDSIVLSVVEVLEVDGPQDGTDLHWRLLSTLPVDTTEQILRIVELYVARWPIEVFFRVFKTGCRVEEIQLETKDRLITALMFYKVIAWRILYHTFLGRECPDLPCDVVFSEAEWKSVWQIVEKEVPPPEPPTLEQFIPVLAELGGYNNRRGDGPPGAEVLWRATRRMYDFALAWETFQPDPPPPPPTCG